MQFWISQVGASKELHTLGNLASKGAGLYGKGLRSGSCRAARKAKLPSPRAAELDASGSLCFQAREGPRETCPGLMHRSSSGLQEGAACLQHLEAISERLRCPADVRQGESSSPAREGGPGGGRAQPERQPCNSPRDSLYCKEIKVAGRQHTQGVRLAG